MTSYGTILKKLDGLAKESDTYYGYTYKCIEAGKKAGVQEPAAEQKVFTNFIR